MAQTKEQCITVAKELTLWSIETRNVTLFLGSSDQGLVVPGFPGSD